MKKVYSSLALLFFGAVFGYVTSQYAGTWSSISRDPAAVSIKWNYDYSSLSGEDLRLAIRQRLISPMVIQKTADGSGLALGHFEFLNSKGEKKLACHEYENITMIFTGETNKENDSNIKNSKVGTPSINYLPRMEVTGKCHYSEDLTMIRPIVIPVSTIQGEKAEDGEFLFKDEDNLYVKFKNINETWPSRWTLQSFQLVGNNNNPLIFTEEEIKKSLGSLPVLAW